MATGTAPAARSIRILPTNAVRLIAVNARNYGKLLSGPLEGIFSRRAVRFLQGNLSNCRPWAAVISSIGDWFSVSAVMAHHGAIYFRATCLWHSVIYGYIRKCWRKFRRKFNGVPSKQFTILANILTSPRNKNISAEWLLGKVRCHRGPNMDISYT
jgi:hypothetical protein